MQMWSGAVSGVAGKSKQIALCDGLSDFDRSFRQMSVTDDHAIAAVHIDTDAVATVPTGLYDGSGGAALDRRADIDREVDSVVRSASARTDVRSDDVIIDWNQKVRSLLCSDMYLAGNRGRDDAGIDDLLGHSVSI